LVRRRQPGRPRAGAAKRRQDSWPDLWYKNDRQVWHEGYGPAVATDFYHRFREDVQLMKQAGLTHYRTSINWSRFLTDYENGVVDEEYAAYYDQLFDEMARNRIVPMICLEHYELPGYLLETYGGWASKKWSNSICFTSKRSLNAFKVTRWFTFNEPIVVQTRVYLDALRWPYEQNTSTWMQWNHHKILPRRKW
jgi:beta-glucosidase